MQKPGGDDRVAALDYLPTIVDGGAVSLLSKSVHAAQAPALRVEIERQRFDLNVTGLVLNAVTPAGDDRSP